MYACILNVCWCVWILCLYPKDLYISCYFVMVIWLIVVVKGSKPLSLLLPGVTIDATFRHGIERRSVVFEVNQREAIVVFSVSIVLLFRRVHY